MQKNNAKGFTLIELLIVVAIIGIIAAIVQNEHYDTFERYLDALADALQVEYEAIVRANLIDEGLTT